MAPDRVTSHRDLLDKGWPRLGRVYALFSPLLEEEAEAQLRLVRRFCLWNCLAGQPSFPEALQLDTPATPLWLAA